MRNFIDIFVSVEEPLMEEFTRDDMLVETWTRDRIKSEVNSHYGMVVDGPEIADRDPSEYYWSYVADYPVEKIALPRLGFKKTGWKEWMREEIRDWTEEGQPDRYDDLLNSPIREPIVIVEVDGKAYLWDGCHRTGAAAIRGLKTLQALVGIPLSQ